MSRVRTRIIPTETDDRHFYRGHVWFTDAQGLHEVQSKLYSPGSPGDGVKLGFDRKSFSTMTDEVSKAGHPFNSCIHRVCNAAYFDASRLSGQSWIKPGNPVYNFETLPAGNIWVYPTESVWADALTDSMSAADWTSDVIALADSVKGLVQSKTLLAVTLRELPATVRMITNPFGFFKRDWRRTVGGKTASQLARKGANLWLEYQYGWNAMYVDFKNFAKSTEKYIRQAELFQGRTSERFGNRSKVSLQPLPPTTSDSQWSSRINQAKEYSVSLIVPPTRVVFGSGEVQTNVSCWASSAIEQTTSALHKLLFAYGLSREKIIESIWESIPYSFVVDWFVNTRGFMDSPKFNNALATLGSAAVSQLGYSAKVVYPFWGQMITNSAESDWTYQWGYRDPLTGWFPILSAPGYISMYQRYAGLPNYVTPSFWSGRGLSVSQGVSGFSLLFQRFLKR